MSSGAKPSPTLKASKKDDVLVEECLLGNEAAWSELIDKYKNLVFSIPIKFGLSHDDSTDIFQAVCFALVSDLQQLRNPRALAAWLIRLTVHKCIRFKRENQIYLDTEIDEGHLIETGSLPDQLLQELEREQILRETLTEMSPECKQLIELLFFSNPSLHYDQAAQALGLAKGSIGATRMRCLEKLRHLLDKKGFQG
jgi:RNA polymerase sigma factor (sigma-70 family)